ncbi:LysR family transcriptional regulator [Flagellatimonas centrodinii]|uniref:LysR family transcriptional regulator n=1 Tax=Flagellatimonas centrodinii TaxID=2806210 RepID=UPI001FEED135|nr:LysR family transcriptional regulator [Flagellatimonas centrodinii]ULQ48238.1 LysR family transcriptional regulator [Flagellatimonas centrodinii]
MELRHLRYFVAVAEAEHFTRAAEALGMAQPPLSQQIRALETELGVDLFHRLPRGVRLTDAGHSLLEDARRLLQEAERAVERTRRVARGERGRLRVGMINSAPFHPLIPGVIREFRRLNPQLALTLDEGPTPDLAAAVREERMDIAFVRPLLGDTRGLTVETLLDEPMVVALPAAHPLTKRVRVPLLALSIEPFVLFPRTVGAGLYDAIIRSCLEAGFSPRVVQETSQVTSIVNLVAAGLGVSIVPGSMQQVHTDGVVYRPIRAPAPSARLSVVYRAATPTPQLERFIDLTRERARA